MATRIAILSVLAAFAPLASEQTATPARMDPVPPTQELAEEDVDQVDLSLLKATDAQILADPKMYSAADGFTELAAELRSLETRASRKSAHLNAAQRAALREFEDLAKLELRRGLIIAGVANIGRSGPVGIPATSRRAVQTYTNAAERIIASPALNSVKTRVISEVPGYTLTFAPLREFRMRGAGASWSAYSPGQNLAIRAYVFRLTPRERSAGSCFRTVPIWQDPSVHYLNCFGG